MTPRFPTPLRLIALTAACAALGCAGLPRIDPTGERLLVWPKDQPQAATLLAPPSSVVAPAVTSDPFFPQGPVVAAPAGVVATTPGVTPASLALAQVPTDKVSITPERILAPVGSEVVLKASVCTTEGYTLADQKVEWMLGRNGVGQFVEVSGKGFFHPPLLPWNKPKKIDNYLAQGWTANGPLCVTRGTADPSDDVNINRGDAWISVTSANEGTSYIQAYMPNVESWDTRKGAATIYWVDVQWNFPPPSVAGTGRPEVLTTTVTRQSNGTAIEGWLVRYVIADAGAALTGGASGQDVEVRTDAQGRATVEVAPTASGAASTRVNVELIRPAGFGGVDAPRLVVGSGSTTVNWGGGTTPYLSPGGATPLPGSTNPPTPQPQLPSTMPPGGWQAPGTTMPGTTAPPSTGAGSTVPPVAAAKPQLVVELHGDQQAAVGGVANLRILVRNVGNAPATQVKLVDSLDRGLMDPRYPDSREIEYSQLGTIMPGYETQEKTFAFNVLQAGRLCHRFTAECAEGQRSSAEFCVTATQAPEQRTGHVTVVKDGPVQGVVGQTVIFRVTVKNDGQLPLRDIRVLDEYPAHLLRITPPQDLSAQISGGVIARTIEDLQVGQQVAYEIECTCLQPARPVLPAPLVKVTAQTDPPTGEISTSDDHDFEILPARGGAAPPAGGLGAGGVGASGAAPGLGIRTTFFSPTARVATRTTCQITVVNNSAVDDERIAVRVAFPPQLTPDINALQAQGVQASLVGNQLTFPETAMLRSREVLTYTIPMNVAGSGVVEVVAGALSKNVPAGASNAATIELIPQ
jgi:uncharacterized repeat protein (TIGR01451 family)